MTSLSTWNFSVLQFFHLDERDDFEWSYVLVEVFTGELQYTVELQVGLTSDNVTQ